MWETWKLWLIVAWNLLIAVWNLCATALRLFIIGCVLVAVVSGAKTEKAAPSKLPSDWSVVEEEDNTLSGGALDRLSSSLIFSTRLDAVGGIDMFYLHRKRATKGD
jgi:hypothetical protein